MLPMSVYACRKALRRAGSLLLAASLVWAGCASSGDVEQVRQERAQAKAKMSAELQQERALAASMEKESEAKKASAEKLAQALGGKGNGKSSSLGASGPCPNNTATNQLAVQVVNDSGLPDSQVYVLLTGKGIGWTSSGVPSGLAYLDIGVNPTGTQAAGALSSLTPCGTTISPYTGATRNVYQFSVSAISSGRLMVSYTTPVAVTNGAFPNGTESFRWDKMELAYPAPGGADLTSMDFFGIPMQYDYLDNSSNVLATMTYYTSTGTILNQLYGLSSQMGTAFLPSGWTPSQGVSPFIRVMGPSLLASNSTTGSPAPYPSYASYLASLVGQSFADNGFSNAGCPAIPYSYNGKFASDGKGGYTVTLTGTTTGAPCGIPPGVTTAQGTATITNPGSDYFSGAPTVTFTGGGGSGAQGTATLSSSGTVSGVTISNGGTGYTSAPTVTFSAPPTPPSNVTLPANLTVTVNLPAPSSKAGYDVNLYGAPATAFTVPTTGMTPQQIASVPNSLYAVIAGDFMAGMNFGYAGKKSNAPQNTANWYSNPPTLYPFGGARTTNDGYYNPYAAVFYNLSDAYGFAYSDRGGRPSPFVPVPSGATTLRVTILNDTRLDAPIVTVSNPTNTSLAITWPPSSSATGYTVNVSYGGGIPVSGITLNPATPSPSGTTISGLSPGTTYQLSVTATGSSIQSYTVPVYGTTTGQIKPPSGSIPFGTSLSWSANTSGKLPSGYQISINNSSYTLGASVPIQGAQGLNIYGLTIRDASSKTVYQGNYVVNLSSLTPSSIPPGVTFGAPNVGSSFAKGTTTASGGAVTSVTVTNGGSGYTSVPGVGFDPSPGGTVAQGTATISGGAVTSVTVTNGGSYTMFNINNAFLTPPISNLLTPGWNGGSANSFPTVSILNNNTLGIGTPFAPVPGKQASTVCFPGHC